MENLTAQTYVYLDLLNVSRALKFQKEWKISSSIPKTREKKSMMFIQHLPKGWNKSWLRQPNSTTGEATRLAAEETAEQLSLEHNFVQLMAICRTMAEPDLSKQRQLFEKWSVCKRNR